MTERLKLGDLVMDGHKIGMVIEVRGDKFFVEWCTPPKYTFSYPLSVARLFREDYLIYRDKGMTSLEYIESLVRGNK